MAPEVDLTKMLRDLPQGDRWLEHLRDDLLPFWTMESALGNPIGNFPTYRSNDGSLYSPDNPSSELHSPSVAGIVNLERDYVRSKSRQAFAYGVAYHMNGDEKLLGYAKAGVDFLRENALDAANGGAYSYWTGDNRTPGPPAAQRTSQDLAYALSGMGFLYYLTRDDALLKDILKLKTYIFDTYYDSALDLITWVNESSADGDDPGQRELVSQLDQVYGYMLWLYRSVPEPHRTEWSEDLVHLAHIMIEQFFSSRNNIFWGAITSTESRKLGMDHTDYGHSIKTLWLIRQIGKLTNNLDLTLFATERASQMLRDAYIEETGSWARGLDAHGDRDDDKEWWSLAELDQTAATFSLSDPAWASYLTRTYAYWFKNMVDHENHGIWHMVRASDNTPVSGIPKQHSWKNALHSFEHALVGYVTAQQLHGKPARLYYAFSNEVDPSTVQPYFYQGKLAKLREVPGSAVRRQEATFSDIR